VISVKWRRRPEPSDPDGPSEKDYEAVDRMIGPGGGWSLAVLQVTGVEGPPPHNARYARCRVTGVLQRDLLPATAVEENLSMPVGKWLRAGDEVAVLVRLSRLDARKPGAVQVIWGRLEERGAPGSAEARAQAARLRGEPVDPDTSPEAELYRTGVVGDADRPLPGSPGGGTTAEQAQALVHDGTRATATVVAAVEVEVPRLLRATVFRGGPPVDLTLEITRPDGTTHRVRTRVGFSTPERRARVARVGAVLPVRLDPDDPDKFAIDTMALGFT
jgi:hypothetical protein